MDQQSAGDWAVDSTGSGTRTRDALQSLRDQRYWTKLREEARQAVRQTARQVELAVGSRSQREMERTAWALLCKKFQELAFEQLCYTRLVL